MRVPASVVMRVPPSAVIGGFDPAMIMKFSIVGAKNIDKYKKVHNYYAQQIDEFIIANGYMIKKICTTTKESLAMDIHLEYDDIIIG